MAYTVALAQVVHPHDGKPLDQAERFVRAAADANAQLVVFPESLMTPYSEERSAFVKAAESLDGPFSTGLCSLAKTYSMWIAYTMNERGDGTDERPFNTAVLADSTGARRGVYRKTHLFDTDFTRESDRMRPGSALFTPVEAPFATIGMATCYDLRFPEIARTLALQGCTLLLYPASWVDGPDKIAQWKTLLAARAIENELFVAGVSRADEGRIGHSCLFGPRGELIAEGGSGEELIVGTVDPALIERTRKALPVFAHRRPELYRL